MPTTPPAQSPTAWADIKARGPFEARMDSGSTGWIEVYGKDGVGLCTCYHDGATAATCIAAALGEKP